MMIVSHEQIFPDKVLIFFTAPRQILTILHLKLKMVHVLIFMFSLIYLNGCMNEYDVLYFPHGNVPLLDGRHLCF